MLKDAGNGLVEQTITIVEKTSNADSTDPQEFKNTYVLKSLVEGNFVITKTRSVDGGPEEVGHYEHAMRKIGEKTFEHITYLNGTSRREKQVREDGTVVLGQTTVASVSVCTYTQK